MSEQWEKEFDERFVFQIADESRLYKYKALENQYTEDLKSFIRTLLKEEREKMIRLLLLANETLDRREKLHLLEINRLESKCADELEEIIGEYKQHGGNLDNLIKKWREK